VLALGGCASAGLPANLSGLGEDELDAARGRLLDHLEHPPRDLEARDADLARLAAEIETRHPDWPERVHEAIRLGRVTELMTPRQVEMSWGPPQWRRSYGALLHYGYSPLALKFPDNLVFRGGRLVAGFDSATPRRAETVGKQPFRLESRRREVWLVAAPGAEPVRLWPWNEDQTRSRTSP